MPDETREDEIEAQMDEEGIAALVEDYLPLVSTPEDTYPKDHGEALAARLAGHPDFVSAPEDCEHGYRAAGGTADCPSCAEDTDGEEG